MSRMRTLLRLIRRISGMPDYDAFVEHLRDRHPDQAIPDRREYYDRFLESRYGTGTNRCC